MKINPYAYILCAAAFLGLPLVSVSAPAADEETVPPSVLKKYDANKDGTLDATEKAAWQADKEKERAARAAQRAEDLARYDKDKDGKLEKDERAVMKADDEKARAEKKATAVEAKKLAKYDKNQNGKLDDDELAVMKADEEKHKAAAEKRQATIETKKQAKENEPDPDSR
jgi:Ca2+-binding EF-hand superfamily protein